MSSASAISTSSAAPVASSEPKEDTYSDHFPLYASADLVVRSSDGTLFATRKFYLQAASSVFEVTLDMASDGDTRDGRPILQLSEKGDELELLFAQIHREPVEVKEYVGTAGLELAAADLIRLSCLVEKYAVSTKIITSFLQQQSATFIKLEETEIPQDGPDGSEIMAFTLLGVGLIHDIPTVASFGLNIVMEEQIQEVGQSVLTHADETHPDERSDGWRYPDVLDVPSKLLGRVPIANLRSFASVMSKRSNIVGYTTERASGELFEAVEARQKAKSE